MTKDKRRKCDRGANGFETARRHRDDEAIILTLENTGQGVCDGLDVPVVSERVIGRDDRKDGGDEAVEVVPKDCGDETGIHVHDSVSLVPSLAAVASSA